MIELYKDGDNMAIVTDVGDEEEFLNDMSDVFGDLIDHGIYENDWAFQFGRWLPAIVDICCKLRGYKNNVAERRVLCAGASGFPNTFRICSYRERKLNIYSSSNRELQDQDDDD